MRTQYDIDKRIARRSDRALGAYRASAYIGVQERRAYGNDQL